jgi:hypothetical protein
MSEQLKYELKYELVNIVFLGEFVPSIIHPLWLAKKGIIGEKEAEDANIKIIHSDISQINLGWCLIEVTRNRFEIKSEQSASFAPAKDLIINIFRVLRESVIKAIGINHVFEYDLMNKDNFYNLGNMIAPLKLWSNSLENPLVDKLDITEPQRKGEYNGTRRIRVATAATSTKPYYAEFAINDHYDLEDNPSADSNVIATELLTKQWEYSRSMSQEIVENILSKLP